MARVLVGLVAFTALANLAARHPILPALLDGNSQIYAGSAAIAPTASGYVLCGDTLAFETNQAWTITALINSSQVPGEDGASVIVCKIDKGPSYRGYELWIDNDGHLVGECISDYATDNRIAVVGSTMVADGSWHSVALTYDGTCVAPGLKLYIDGAEEPSTVWADNLTGSIAGTTSLAVGTQLTWSEGEYFRGTIGQVTISDIARGSAYFATHATSTNLPPIDSRMQLYYNFSEGFGAFTTDASGHGRTGILTKDIWVHRPRESALSEDDQMIFNSSGNGFQARHFGVMPGVGCEVKIRKTRAHSVGEIATIYLIDEALPVRNQEKVTQLACACADPELVLEIQWSVGLAGCPVGIPLADPIAPS